MGVLTLPSPGQEAVGVSLACLLVVVSAGGFGGSGRSAWAPGILRRLAAVLAVAVVATLGGARNYREMGPAAEDFSQGLLAKVGAR